MSITLIGMPGCGKSTIGRMLAARLGLSFIDLDDYIREKEGRDTGEILEKEGEKKLKEYEEAYALSVPLKNVVLAPYGSIVFSEQAMRRLTKETIVIFIDVSSVELEKRIGNDSIRTRRIIGLDEKGWDGVYSERLPLYRKYATHTVVADRLTEDAVLAEVVSLLCTTQQTTK